MIHLSARDVEATLPGVLEQVARGETILIVEGDQPIAELRPVAPPPTSCRPIGLGQGQGTILPAFYQPLPPDLLAAFSGEPE